MRKKQARFSGRWSKKNLHLLKTIGYIDGRSNTKINRKENNINGLINYAVEQHLLKVISKDNPNLRPYENLYKQNIKEQNDVITEAQSNIQLNAEKIRLLRKEDDEKHMKKVLKEVSSQG